MKADCILIINDDKVTSLFHKSLLEEAGYTGKIIIENSGLAGLDYLSFAASPNSTEPFPILIFLDLNMPEMNGWEFLARFAKMKGTFPELPKVILITSDADALTISKCFSLPEVTALRDKPLTLQKVGYLLQMKPFH